jgi:hypothetical protein
VVRYLIREAGIKQIIDVGAGLPTVGNTHEVALAHARSMLHGVPGTAVIGWDMLGPGSILADPALRVVVARTN